MYLELLPSNSYDSDRHAETQWKSISGIASQKYLHPLGVEDIIPRGAQSIHLTDRKLIYLLHPINLEQKSVVEGARSEQKFLVVQE